MFSCEVVWGDTRVCEWFITIPNGTCVFLTMQLNIMFSISIYFGICSQSKTFFCFPFYIYLLFVCKNWFFAVQIQYTTDIIYFISLSFIIPGVPMRGCLGRHSCVSSLFIIAIPNDTCVFLIMQLKIVYFEECFQSIIFFFFPFYIYLVLDYLYN